MCVNQIVFVECMLHTFDMNSDFVVSSNEFIEVLKMRVSQTFNIGTGSEVYRGYRGFVYIYIYVRIHICKIILHVRRTCTVNGMHLMSQVKK